MEDEFSSNEITTKPSPKFSWAHMLIILLVAAIAGGGVWAYYKYKILPDMSIKTEPTKVQEQKGKTKGFIITDATAGLTTYYQVDLNYNKTKLFEVKREEGAPPSEGDLSSDEKKIVYEDNLGNLLIFDMDSKQSQVILKGVMYDIKKNNTNQVKTYAEPNFSPDGQKITMAYYGWEWRGRGIANADGTNYQDVQGAHDDKICWFSDSKKFVAAGVNNGMGGELAYLSIVTIPDLKLSNILPENKGKANSFDTFKDVYDPQVSKDDKKIAISYRYKDYGNVANENQVNKFREIYTVNSDGKDFNALTKNESYSISPFWLGTDKIVYGLSNLQNDQKGIYSIKTDGSENTQLFTDDYKSYKILGVSADRKYIIYSASEKDLIDLGDIPTYLFIYDINKKESKPLSENSLGGFVGWITN